MPSTRATGREGQIHCGRTALCTRVARRALGALAALALLAAAGEAGASVQSEIAFHKGVVAFGEGRYDDAKQDFEAVLAEDAEDTAALHYLGLIASEQGDSQAAIALYRRALAIDPDDPDIRFDLGSALLEADDAKAARAEFDRVLAAQPDRARAHLFAGIAAYRDGAFREALPNLDRAVELDPTLRAQARYYTGLSQTRLQDFPAAAGAFSEVEQSPQSPLTESARQLRGRVDETEETKRWSLSLTAGMEFDSNPTIAGQTLNQDADGRGVYRIRGQVLLIDDDTYSLTAGYDGYVSTHFEETFVDLMTHVGYLSGRANFDPVSFALRYDYAYTWIDLDKKFRSLHRVTPTVGVREGNWGYSQIFYQLQLQDYMRNIPATGPLHETDRDGDRHTVGFNQFVFPGDRLPAYVPLTYVRFGALGDFQNTSGSEFAFDSWEFSFGFGVQLPWDVDLSVLYRLTDRGYRHPSQFDTVMPGEVRDDLQNRLTFELVKAFGQHWQVSAAGSFTFNDSDVPLYDYNREVVGAYLTYVF